MRHAVVYYGVLINDWQDHMIKHIERTISAGLYDATALFYVSVVDFDDQRDILENLLSKYSKIQIDYHTEITPNNLDKSLRHHGEYWGVKLIDNLGKQYDDLHLLYLHSKGVVNKWKNFDTKEYSEQRVKCVGDWVECMMYFLVDKWKESTDYLDAGYDTVGVTNVNRWWWGNFWWTKSSHIQKNIEFMPVSRWYSEGWLHEGNEKSNEIKYYEWWHWSFDPFFTDHPRFLYDGSYDTTGKKIIIHKAEFGWQSHQRDEGYEYVDEYLIDVTDKVKNLMVDETSLNMELNEYTLGVNTTEIDNKRAFKSTFITYSFEDRPEILKYSSLLGPTILPIK